MNSNFKEEVIIGQEWFKEVILKSSIDGISGENKKYERRLSQIINNQIYYRLKPFSRLKATFSFIAYFVLINFLIIRSFIFSKKIKNKQVIIWDSNVEHFVTCETFHRFLQSGQVIKLSKDHVLIVKSNQRLKIIDEVFYCQRPIFDTLSILNFSITEYSSLLFNIVLNFFIFLKISWLFPQCNTIWKDFLTEPLIKLYKKNGLEEFYRTISEITSQEFWCENLNFNTVWYSTNSRVNLYRDVYLEKFVEYPFYYFCFLGTSWSWNTKHAEWLKDSLKISKVRTVGPILFYPFEQSSSQSSVPNKRVLIFDVTPHEPGHIEAHVLQKGVFYYDERTCSQFIQDVLFATKEQDLEVQLKPKRNYAKVHSHKYIQLLEDLKKEFHFFSTISPSSNLFDEIISASLIVCIPFSGPFDIAKHLGIQTLYYDPTGRIDFERMGYTSEDYCNDPEQLKDRIKKMHSSLATHEKA